MLALARKIVAGEEEGGSVESVFEQAQQVAAEAEALLVDDGWREPEPKAVAAALGDDGTRQDVYLAPEQQRSLFSWAEFLAGEPDETERPKGRHRHEAPTLSLFEWAQEREQEGVLAGAG